MQSNFHLNVRKQNKDLRISLYGVFDGSSALELIQILERKQHLCRSFFIDTTNLTQAFPFGSAVLNTHLPRKKFRKRLRFTGALAADILPDGCILMDGNKSEGHLCKGECRYCACTKPARRIATS